MLGFIVVTFIIFLLVVGWIVGTVRDAIDIKEYQRKLSSIKNRIKDIDKKYPRALYLKFKKDVSCLTDDQLMSLYDVPESEWSHLEQSAVKNETIDFLTEWQDRQDAFSKISRRASIKDWGCYYYYIDVVNKDCTRSDKAYQFKVWHHFLYGYSIDYFLDIEDKYGLFCRSFHKAYDILVDTEDCKYSYPNIVYDELANFLEALSQDVLILFADSGKKTEADSFNDFHFKYLQQKLSERYTCVSFHDYVYNGREYFSGIGSNIVIIEAVTCYESFMNNCALVLNHKQNWQKNYYNRYPNITFPIPTYNSEEAPIITYVSLLKEYSTEEVQTLIKDKEQEYELEQARKKKEEEERLEFQRLERLKKEEEERLRLLALEDEKRRRENFIAAKQRLQNAVIEWSHPTRSLLRCFSMFNYYPTDQKYAILADDKDWDVRYLIWNFKAQPPNETPIETIIYRHRQAVTTLSRIVKDFLSIVFGDDTQYLTLVCVPSSKDVINKRRFEDFSEVICEMLQMENGFQYVKLISDGEAAHFGGEKKVEYVIDEEFFKDKYILLFDDVITSGKSMERMRKLLVEKGAIVIGGFSIGRTLHEKMEYHPIDNLINYTI